MAEAINSPHGIDTSQVEGQNVHGAHRDMVLGELLGVDYEYAQNSGLIDAFYVNPETGEDGLLHILSGDLAVGPDGAHLPQGFHHEPSARDSRTFVDRTHLEGARSDHRKVFREFPYEPYVAEVVVDGLAKRSVRVNTEGQSEIVSARSNMYPKEYDALAVMQTIVQARNNRDTSNDRLVNEGKVIISEGPMVLLDGKTIIRLRLALDASTGKIMSAYPAERSKSSYLKLSKAAIQQHLGLQ